MSSHLEYNTRLLKEINRTKRKTKDSCGKNEFLYLDIILIIEILKDYILNERLYLD